jgi:SDR family mycofactocin-dependent oxidoreductase
VITKRFDGKVALVTGAARGQGRSHAVRLAREGANVIAVDACRQITPTQPYPAATESDLQQTVALVHEAGGRSISLVADVRDFEALRRGVVEAMDDLGPVDIVSANAGTLTFGTTWTLDEQAWRDVIDVNLTGAWHTAKAVIPEMINKGDGGVIVFTGSGSSLQWTPFLGHYVASKHGLIGLMRNLANELASQRIRVNVICPSAVDTPMADGSGLQKLLANNPEWADSFRHPMPIDLLTPDDISNALLWLASDEARFVTGVVLPIDAGLTVS